MQINSIEILKDIFSEVLLCPKEALNLYKSYVDQGVDSVSAIQIAKLIKLQTGIDLLYSDLYNFLSIYELAQQLDAIISTQTNVKNDLKRGPSATTTVEIAARTTDKVAIIGIAGRFPGATNIHHYWNNLHKGKCSISPTSRWEASTSYVGGFLDNIARFDATFFAISPREAQRMDPQQRLLMEVAWEAFEDAGLSLSQLSHSKCGVFTTSLPGDYKYYLQQNASLHDNFSFLGNAVSVAAGRIAHFFNLKGIALHIDAACSSSLVAIDLAITHLQNHSCDIAIVGASSIFSTPELFELAQVSGLLSKSGLCHTFDAHADGFVPAEAIACIVLRRLSDAEGARQPIYGIIEGSCVNHDGHTNGLMSPNSHAQKALICTSYKQYHINPLQIGYVEAHGTGTAMGDPIEVKALKESFEIFNNAYHCFLGSCKTNIGHALVASGLASIIKILLIFKNEIIPPHLHFTTLNAQIDLGNFSINTMPEKWLSDKKFAVVSAFGFSGTNAHIILRKPDLKPVYPIAIPHLFLFSAQSKAQLIHLLHNYNSFLQEKEDQDLANISYSLICTRTRLDKKFITIAQNVRELIHNINDFLNKSSPTVTQHATQEWLPLTTIQAKFQEHVVHPLSNSEIYDLLQALTYHLRQDAQLKLSFLYDNRYYKVPLPAYPFQATHFWITEAPSILQDKETVPNKQAPAYVPTHLEKQKKLMVQQIKEKLAALLSYNVTDIVEDKNINHYGVDSIIALQLLASLGFHNMDPSILFNSKNIDDLADRLIIHRQNNVIQPSPNRTHDQILQIFPLQSILDRGIEWYILGEQQNAALVLLPPLNALASIWIQQLRFFLRTTQYCIYIPHYPGHGESLYKPYTLEEIAQNIIDSFATIAPYSSPFDMMGWPLGGCLSMQIGYLPPHRVNKMVLVNTTAQVRIDLFAQSSALREALISYDDYLSNLYQQKLASNMAYISVGCSLDILQHYYSRLQQLDIVAQLKTLTQKCLIMYGTRDRVIAQSDIDTLQTIPHSIVKKFDNEGHFLPLTAPFVFNKAAYAFLKQ